VEASEAVDGAVAAAAAVVSALLLVEEALELLHESEIDFTLLTL
jgi:hypothetical protein